MNEYGVTVLFVFMQSVERNIPETTVERYGAHLQKMQESIRQSRVQTQCFQAARSGFPFEAWCKVDMF